MRLWHIVWPRNQLRLIKVERGVLTSSSCSGSDMKLWVQTSAASFGCKCTGFHKKRNQILIMVNRRQIETITETAGVWWLIWSNLYRKWRIHTKIRDDLARLISQIPNQNDDARQAVTRISRDYNLQCLRMCYIFKQVLIFGLHNKIN